MPFKKLKEKSTVSVMDRHAGRSTLIARNMLLVNPVPPANMQSVLSSQMHYVILSTSQNPRLILPFHLQEYSKHKINNVEKPWIYKLENMIPPMILINV